MFTAACYYWDEENIAWSADGIRVSACTVKPLKIRVKSRIWYIQIHIVSSSFLASLLLISHIFHFSPSFIIYLYISFCLIITCCFTCLSDETITDLRLNQQLCEHIYFFWNVCFILRLGFFFSFMDMASPHKTNVLERIKIYQLINKITITVHVIYIWIPYLHYCLLSFILH